MKPFMEVIAMGLLHPAPGSHLPAAGTAPPYAVAPQKPESKAEEEAA